MFRGTSRTPGIEDISFDWKWESITVCDISLELPLLVATS
jgi:hypothetical protein